MSDLNDRASFEANTARIRAVTPTTERRWGKMNAQQMLCHLADGYQVMMGERAGDVRITFFTRTVAKFLALETPMPWPKGTPTGKTVDAMRGGTKPGDFVQDMQRLLDVRARFAEQLPALAGKPHPFFGPMSSRLWGKWGWRHEDHHLRQFGV